MNFGKIDIASLKHREEEENRKKTRTGMSMQQVVNSALASKMPSAPVQNPVQAPSVPEKW